MTREDIIRMAREVGITVAESFHAFVGSTEDLERFAALVAAASASVEREECAKVCALWQNFDLAAAIRARKD